MKKKGRDFTGTPCRRSAFDKQQTHDYGSTSNLASLRTAQDMAVVPKEGPGDASATAASAAKTDGPCSHYQMRAYISDPYLPRVMLLMEAAAAVVSPSWGDDNSPYLAGQSDGVHGVYWVHIPWGCFVGSVGRRPCCQEECARIAAMESSTSILDRAGAVDACCCTEIKVVPYWNGGFMSSAPEALNRERSDQPQPLRSGFDFSNVDLRFIFDLI